MGKRNQVNTNLDDQTVDLLESAAKAFGQKPSQLAAEALAATLPIYVEIKLARIADEQGQLRAALETALGKASAGISPKIASASPTAAARRKKA